MTRRVGSWERVQRVGAVALVPLSLLALGLRAALSPEIPLVVQSERAPWIAPPTPVSAALEQWGRAEPPRVVFRRAFAAEPGDARVVLRLRALRRFAVELNGEPLPGARSDGADWRREASFAIGERLRRGRNELAIEVRHLRGAALLSARIDGLTEPLRSDAAWQVSRDGRALGAAVRADDTRVDPAALAVETPLQALADRRLALLGLLALALLVFAALPSRLGPRARERLPGAALAAAVLAWLGLFAAKFARLPLPIGYDVNHHLAYVAFLREHGRLPLASDGWSMYHPPLFYALSALASWLGERLAGGPAPLALKLIPLLCGLGSLWVAWALARRLFRDDARVALLAVGFAAALPMNLYGTAYFSNEMPHAFAVGAALVVAVELLCAARVSLRAALALGALLGLAALTKFTALIVLLVALFFLLAKLVAVERAPAGRIAARVLACAAAAAALAGWFYARTWIAFGQPLVGNWNLPAEGMAWWQQPGFHTPAYYLGFGEALRHPYLAGFHSFWDGIYSTLWGDGGVAGRVFPSQRHGFWNYGFMSAGYLLALPATALLLFGAVRCAAIALAPGDPGRRAALSFLLTASYAVGLGILALTLELPFFAQAKAYYGLCLTGPLALFFAAGAARCDDALAGLAPARIGYRAVLAVVAATLFLGFAG